MRWIKKEKVHPEWKKKFLFGYITLDNGLNIMWETIEYRTVVLSEWSASGGLPGWGGPTEGKVGYYEYRTPNGEILGRKAFQS